jgi:hypothetical protein
MKIDTSKPHVGRVYDFVLGGHHNYEVDRQFAAQILTVFPAYPKFARLNRWFLQLVASRWAEQGVERVLDIGSGLPTQGHLNEYLTGARILFSDNDPLSVSYGSEILKDSANMKYIMADVRDPAPIFEEATRFFGDERRIAVGFIGLAYMISDDAVRDVAQRLHAWCAPGSVMAVTFLTESAGGGESVEKLMQIAKKLGIDCRLRSTEQLAELIAPWRIVESKPIEEHLDVQGMLTDEDRLDMGLVMNGAIAER